MRSKVMVSKINEYYGNVREDMVELDKKKFEMEQSFKEAELHLSREGIELKREQI